MSDLMHALDERQFKLLAKRYHRLMAGLPVEQRPTTLMQVQESLAQAFGHTTLHAAQAHWARQETAAPPLSVSPSTSSEPVDPALAEALREAARVVAHAFEGQVSHARLWQATREGVEHTAEGSQMYPLSRARFEAALAHELAMPEPALRRTGQPKEFVCTQWEARRAGMLRIIDISQHTEHNAVPLPMADLDSIDAGYHPAVQGVCASRGMAAVLETRLVGLRQPLQVLANAHLRAGYTVWGVGHAQHLAHLLGSCVVQSFVVDELVHRHSQADAQGASCFVQSTLLVVADADMLTTDQVASMLEAAAAAPVPVKVVFLSHGLVEASALQALARHATWCRTDNLRPGRSAEVVVATQGASVHSSVSI